MESLTVASSGHPFSGTRRRKRTRCRDRDAEPAIRRKQALLGREPTDAPPQSLSPLKSRPPLDRVLRSSARRLTIPRGAYCGFCLRSLTQLHSARENQLFRGRRQTVEKAPPTLPRFRLPRDPPLQYSAPPAAVYHPPTFLRIKTAARAPSRGPKRGCASLYRLTHFLKY